MPDALAKTVPIWAAVFNRALFPNATSSHALQFPPEVVSKSEATQIEKSLDEFVRSLKV
jgi:tRNA A64-2'-O-ribosylphosphate transferase